MSLCSLRSSTSARGLKSAISAAMRHGQPAVSHCLIGAIAERPATMASRMSSGDIPAPHTAPVPVTTTDLSTPRVGVPSTSSGWRTTTQLFEPPKPNEFDIATRTRCRRGAPTTKLRSQSTSRSTRFALMGISPRWIGERAHGDLDRAGGGDQVTHRALGRAHVDAHRRRRRTRRASPRSRCGRSCRSTCRARSGSRRRKSSHRRRRAPRASPGSGRRRRAANR